MKMIKYVALILLLSFTVSISVKAITLYNSETIKVLTPGDDKKKAEQKKSEQSKKAVSTKAKTSTNTKSTSPSKPTTPSEPCKSKCSENKPSTTTKTGCCKGGQ